MQSLKSFNQGGVRATRRSSVPVRVGIPVRIGQVIARSGISGNAVGAHLHYEVKTRNGRHVDPLKVRLERGKAERGG